MSPIISNVHCNRLGALEVELDWDTNEPANCQVRYSTHSSVLTYTSGPLHEHYVTSNRGYVLSGLDKDTTYYFLVVAQDITGNTSVTGVYTFKTADVDKYGNPPEPVEEE